MARSAIPGLRVSRTAATAPAALQSVHADDHYIANNDGNVILEVSAPTNTRVVSIPLPRQVDGSAVGPRDVTVEVGTVQLIGPFPPALYNQNDGSVYVDVPASDLDLRVFRLG